MYYVVVLLLGKEGPLAQLVERHICNVDVIGSSPIRSTIISSTEEVEFLFCAKFACLLYKLAVLLMWMRFKLWGDHLVNLRELKDESGLDWRENTFWFVVRTWSGVCGFNAL